MGKLPPRDQASLEEFGRPADGAYDKHVKPNLTPADEGKFVALDVDTGAYEIDDDEFAAIDRLRDRCPEASSWLVHVGRPLRLGWRGSFLVPPEIPDL